MRRPQTSRERVPAEAFPPGEFVREELEARGWTPERFAEMVGWTRGMLDSVLAGTEPITEQQAADLARGFQQSQAFWLGLESAWRRWLGRVEFGREQPEAGECPPDQIGTGPLSVRNMVK